jgi:hypothetical protein
MKKLLKKTSTTSPIWHWVNNKKVFGPHANISGDVTGISGDVTGISGDLDACEITKDDRDKSVKIDDLIGEFL